ncbi:hypothetical protein E2558_10855 [Staphylococcus pragensis]|uniref:Uncharacterized protein n=1 Tax=Staphylococcus pragensis TaxID=1611836 RepID=A0A4Z1B6V6_9STAP|nr:MULTISPECIES: hypothetical protein [Staphylococcus]RTX89486.1 hypothetical protein CD154_06905 [Staphylococcus carnosus]TGN23824.1 hypothetical protein E2558_10855 [Staphylococcus pragensis]GGG96120.1 hypothetical protein GCM10007342_19480 [Staphylococcus pragensis]
MKQFLYISLICGVISGVGIFFNLPNYPSLVIPRLVSIVGIISAILTFKDKNLSAMLKLGGIMINIMPLLGSLLVVR